MTDLERFESHIERIPEAGCWLFMLKDNHSGHVNFTAEREPIGAHRFAYKNYVGDIGDKHVLHTCDVPCCVNPEHLYLGTHQQNMADMRARRRHHGHKRLNEAHPMCKLSDLHIGEIRAKRKQGKTVSALAAEYGVVNGSISRIVRLQTRVLK